MVLKLTLKLLTIKEGVFEVARKTLNEMVEAFKGIVGNTDFANSDSSIEFIEDLTDSMVDDSEEWKKKFEENDNAWRQRYMSRFGNGENIPNPNADIEVDVEEKEATKYSYDNIFKESE